MHPERYSSRKHPEFVVLDIGAGVGALIVYTDGAMHGSEIEISPADDDVHRAHKEVLERERAGHPAFTAVFDTLPAGSYTLWSAGRPPVRGVCVEGGRITELEWRDAAVGGA
jgi:hypothetical protein